MKHRTRPNSPEERAEALRQAIALLRNRYGPHIIRLGADLSRQSLTSAGLVLSTGSLGLDLLTGGLPYGAITEVAGVDGAGKGTLALRILAMCQQAGGLALLVDADGAADPDALEATGVDLERLVLACPTTMREAWEVLSALCRSGAPHLLLLASLPGLLALPQAGGSGYRLGRGLLRLSTSLRGRDTALLITNIPCRDATRTAMGTRGMAARQTAPAGTTVGGAVMAQIALLRIALERDGLRYAPHGEVVALGVVAHVVKHHGLPRPPAIPLEIRSSGPRRAAELIALGRLTGCVQETALGLSMADGLLGRTPERAALALEAAEQCALDLERQVRAAWIGRAPRTTSGVAR